VGGLCVLCPGCHHVPACHEWVAPTGTHPHLAPTGTHPHLPPPLGCSSLRSGCALLWILLGVCPAVPIPWDAEDTFRLRRAAGWLLWLRGSATYGTPWWTHPGGFGALLAALHPSVLRGGLFLRAPARGCGPRWGRATARCSLTAHNGLLSGNIPPSPLPSNMKPPRGCGAQSPVLLPQPLPISSCALARVH